MIVEVALQCEERLTVLALAGCGHEKVAPAQFHDVPGRRAGRRDQETVTGVALSVTRCRRSLPAGDSDAQCLWVLRD
jgi:hypothetical protein